MTLCSFHLLKKFKLNTCLVSKCGRSDQKMDILFTCCKSLFTGLRRDVVCMVDTYLWYFEIWNAYSLSHFYPQHFMRCKQLKQHIWVYNKCYKTIQEVLCHCLNYTNWSLSSHLQCVHVLWNCCQVKWTK